MTRRAMRTDTESGFQEAGYFRHKDRFWTTQEFPQSDTVRSHLEAKLKATGLNDPALREAYETLQATK